jgi:8-oxo-dGTP diphosphatase
MAVQRVPRVTVDVVIEHRAGGVVLIRRRHPPPGWAIPGGFVDYGETVEDAARREAAEETGLAVALRELFGVYSDPRRDARGHTVSIVFIASADGIPHAADDAADVGIFAPETPPAPLAFDHGRILADYLAYRRTGRRPSP